jgi:hypothetical protein
MATAMGLISEFCILCNAMFLNEHPSTSREQRIFKYPKWEKTFSDIYARGMPYDRKNYLLGNSISLLIRQ